jgi:hypothetical protein
MPVKRMLILRGNATKDATIYPDEQGRTRAWPDGALHEKAAIGFAKQLTYNDIVIVDGSGSPPRGKGTRQTDDALDSIHEVKDADAEIGLYGFSGGGYTVFEILKYLAKNEPESLRRIRHVIVIGAPNDLGDDAIYQPAYYDALVVKDNPKIKDWKPLRWTPIFRKNPKPEQMPKGVTLPEGVDTHMFGPDVLLMGWPEDRKPEPKPKPDPKPAAPKPAHHSSKK